MTTTGKDKNTSLSLCWCVSCVCRAFNAGFIPVKCFQQPKHLDWCQVEAAAELPDNKLHFRWTPTRSLPACKCHRLILTPRYKHCLWFEFAYKKPNTDSQTVLSCL